jgi:phosphoserine aminotransferase
MSALAKPAARPANPRFSTGPTTKIPGWTSARLDGALLGRVHRSGVAKARLKHAIDLTHELLQLPQDYRVAIVPASDTGAVEMALWSLLGARGVDLLAWESFGAGWVKDVVDQLKLDDVRVFEAEYGALPDLAQVSGDRDIVFTWNGTTSGVRVPDADWIAPDREGLAICDATSAVFAQSIDWRRLDAVTFSWQKALGGEAAHGMLILSPRAARRLESYTPPWPLPKIFRMTSNGRLNEALFEGATINTPSMLCLEDYIVALEWARDLGGLEALIARADANTEALGGWVEATPWADFLARDPATRSNTSVCLSIVDPAFTAMAPDARAAFAKKMVGLLDAEAVAHDIGSYRDAPPGLRIWCGGTVEVCDIEALCPWLDWAFETAKRCLADAA